MLTVVAKLASLLKKNENGDRQNRQPKIDIKKQHFRDALDTLESHVDGHSSKLQNYVRSYVHLSS